MKINGWKMTCPLKLVPFFGTFVHFQGVVYLKEWMLRAFSGVFFFFSILAQGKACCRWTVRTSFESAISRGQASGFEIANMYVEQVSESQVGLNLVTSRCHGHWLLIIKLDPQMFLAKLRRSLIPLAPLSLVEVLNETHKKQAFSRPELCPGLTMSAYFLKWDSLNL